MAYVSSVSGSKLQAKLSTTFNEAAASTSHLQPTTSFAARHMKKLGWIEGTGLGKEKKGIVSHLKVVKRDDEQKLGLGRERGESYNHHMNTNPRTVSASAHHHQSLLSETLMKLQQKQRKSEKSSSKDDCDDSDNDGYRKDRKKQRKDDKKIKGEIEHGSETDKELDLEQKRKMVKKEKKRRKRKNEGDREEKKEYYDSVTKSNTSIKIYTDEELFQATGGARFGMRAQRRAHGKWKRTESSDIFHQIEQEAKQNIEWNGLGPAKIILGNTLRKDK